MYGNGVNITGVYSNWRQSMTTTRAAAPAATSQPKASPENASPAKKPPFSRMAYTAEYKEAAVSLVLVNKMSIAEAANNLGISAQTLRNWIKMRQAGGELASTNSKVDEREMELLTLQAENRRLRKEVLLLKKFQAYLTTGKI